MARFTKGTRVEVGRRMGYVAGIDLPESRVWRYIIYFYDAKRKECHFPHTVTRQVERTLFSNVDQNSVRC